MTRGPFERHHRDSSPQTTTLALLFPTTPVTSAPTAPQTEHFEGLSMDVKDILRSLPTNADLKVLMVELKTELHKKTKAVGDKLLALHDQVEAGETALNEADA